MYFSKGFQREVLKDEVKACVGYLKFSNLTNYKMLCLCSNSEQKSCLSLFMKRYGVQANEKKTNNGDQKSENSLC